MSTLKVDAEFKALIPPLRDDEREQLERNLAADGCREPLVVWGDVLLDGHNRYEICTRRGIAYKTVPAVGVDTHDDAKLWIVRNQLGRRNISDFVRAELALVAKPLIEAKARANQQGGKGGVLLSQNSDEAIRTDEAVAELASVSRDTVRKVEKIKETAAPELFTNRREGTDTYGSASSSKHFPDDDRCGDR